MASPTDLPPDVSKGPLLLGVVLALLVLTLLHVGLRLQTRIFLSRAIGWDDYFALAAMILGTVQIAFVIASVHYGYGRHVSYLSPDNAMEAFKYSLLAEPSNVFAIGLVKISISIALLRLDLGRIYKTVVWLALVPNIGFTVVILITIFARCRPFSKSWDFEAPGRCWPLQINITTGYILAASNIVLDMVYAISPIVALAKVKLSKYNRFAVRIIFLVALFATVCSIVKISCLPALNGSTDFTYTGVSLTLWATGELMVGLMVACAPALKPRYEAFVRAFVGATHMSTSRSQPPDESGKYDTAKSRVAHGHGLPIGDEGLKLDYFYMPSDLRTTRVDTGAKTFVSENSSDEINLQGAANSSEALSSDRIRVTKIIEIQNQRTGT